MAKRKLDLEKLEETFVKVQAEQDRGLAEAKLQLAALKAELDRAKQQAVAGPTSNTPAIAAASVKADAAQRSTGEADRAAKNATREANNASRKLGAKF